MKHLPALVLCMGLAAFPALAKKVLVFDESQGIIWVEDGKKKDNKAFDLPDTRKKTVIIEEKTVMVREHIKTKPLTPEDYRATGQKFYFNSDYSEALKYFEKAHELKQDPVDYFWIGVCYRKMDRIDDMTRVFTEIGERFPKCEVADDALFYLAVQAQKDLDYQLAYDRYREVVEFFPDGVSIIGKFGFRDEAKQQLRAIKFDIVSRIKLVGYETDDNMTELVRRFQTDHRLPATGNPDRTTMELLFKLSDEKETTLRSQQDGRDALLNERSLYFSILCVLLLMNIVWGVRNLVAVRDEKRRIETLTRELK